MTDSSTFNTGFSGTPGRKEAPSRTGLRLGSILGTEIRADWSLLIVFVLVLGNLGIGLFPRWHPEWSAPFAWAMAFAAATLFFVSVLLHELSHAVVGRAQGIPVHRITLFMFGGVAHLEEEPSKPKAEFWMAIAGPVTSLGIGVASTAAGVALAQNALSPFEADLPEQVLSRLAPVPTLLLWLGPINVVLAVFNVLPGFPLDGGRVLRSILWAITGDFTRATGWAAGVGRVLGWLLIALGVLQALSGAAPGGLWLVLIGWFLSAAARVTHQRAIASKLLEDVSVSDVMRTRIPTVGPSTTVESLLDEVLLVSDQECIPVVAQDGELLGLVSLADVRSVPMDRWADVSVRDVMQEAASVGTLPPSAAARAALDAMAQRNVDQLPIVQQGRLLGLVSGRDLVKRLSLTG